MLRITAVRSRWIAQRRPVAANGREHSLGVGTEQIGDEHVGMLRREIVGREALRREVPQVPSHDRVRTSFNRGGQRDGQQRVCGGTGDGRYGVRGRGLYRNERHAHLRAVQEVEDAAVTTR